jgi:hypothetical protein
MMFRAVFWVVLPCKLNVDNQFTRQYNAEDSSEHLQALGNTALQQNFYNKKQPPLLLTSTLFFLEI